MMAPPPPQPPPPPPVRPMTPEEAERARRTEGQRAIHRIWEMTQSFVALMVTFTTLTVAAMLSARGNDPSAFILLSNAFFVVIGFYFGRNTERQSIRKRER